MKSLMFRSLCQNAKSITLAAVSLLLDEIVILGSPSPTFKAPHFLKVYVLKHLEGPKTPSGGPKSPSGDQKSDIVAMVKVKNMKSSFLKSFFKQCKRPRRSTKTIGITERNASHLKILFNVDESIIKLSLNYQSFTPEPIPFSLKNHLVYCTLRSAIENTTFFYKFYEKIVATMSQ